MIAVPRAIAVLAVLTLVAACSFGTRRPPSYDYAPYVSSDPRSVLVAPMAGLEARTTRFLATVAQPLAERGYYVMPIRLTQDLMAEEGFKERAQEQRIAWLKDNATSYWSLVDETNHPAVREMAVELAAMSGADSVLFVFILAWGHELDISEGFLANLVDDKKNHHIDLDYLLVDAGGKTLWRARKRVEFTRGGGGIFREMWNAAHKPSDEEIDTAIARDVNRLMIEARRTNNKMTGSWYDAFPMLVGPYHPSYDADRARRRPAEGS